MIGLDVGGANTKAAVVHEDGRVQTVSDPFEVWRAPEALADAILFLASDAARAIHGAALPVVGRS